MPLMTNIFVSVKRSLYSLKMIFLEYFIKFSMETFPFWWVIHCVALLQYFDENIGGMISIPIDIIAGVDIKS